MLPATRGHDDGIQPTSERGGGRRGSRGGGVASPASRQGARMVLVRIACAAAGGQDRAFSFVSSIVELLFRACLSACLSHLILVGVVSILSRSFLWWSGTLFDVAWLCLLGFVITWGCSRLC